MEDALALRRRAARAVRFVFHQCVPLVGDLLVPASDLAEIDPDGYARAMAKYDDTPERQHLRNTAIPGTGRTWTEVVFLSPVHPHAIWRAWREVRGKDLPRVEFWAIPAADLPVRTVVLDRSVSAVGDPIDASEVAPFDAASFTTAIEVPAVNRVWLEEMARRGVSGAWFHGIPHVLAPGAVPLGNARVIGWEEPV
ncbi:hypothetical protein [Microbacterium oleivorans]|uniref:Uncharacterized protein n=1 Tax=Microbacterium oleivorans TaxID=273677 RepID=A0A031FWW1_9MICO|nr:hypothetical protein [Microbacterium oleivorans]EZP28115.1 hypothetical protein BW34_01092 [Microbacterium oleivorans]